MTSPLLPGGIACLSFYYTFPASSATLNVMTRTHDNVTVDVWNMTSYVLENMDHFVVNFVAKLAPNDLIGVDNITIERFTCESGYQPIKEDVRDVCVGHSNRVPKCEPVECGNASNAANAVIHYYNGTNNKSYATVTCNVGYRIINGEDNDMVQKYVQCLETGLWNISSGCELKDCGHLTAPQHGNVSHITTTYGYIATESCQTGYTLRGSGMATCGSNGHWSSIGQTCAAVDCGHLQAPQHGIISHITTTYGSTATISCQTGYILRGSGMVTYNSNGYWNSTGQACAVFDCGHLTAPQHGSVTHTTTTYRSIASVSCQTGYILRGSGTVRCGSTGTWSSTGQTCATVVSEMDLNKAIRAGCSSIGWNISVDMSILQQMYPFVLPNNIYFGETSCKGSLSRNILQYTFGFKDCLTNEKISGEAIIYENKLIYATFDLLNSHLIRNHVWTSFIARQHLLTSIMTLTRTILRS
ncbi:E-selectin-like isoform X7 [Dreissena polymorpha]|nr:E-selectin-like isoform X7 [Dreissena polymorpha]